MPLKVRRRSAESLPAHDSGFVTGRLSSWKLTSPVIDAFVSDIRTSNLLVMCLEPGMGQGAALKVMLSDMKQHSATHIFRFSGIEADAASKRLSRFARQVEKECLAGKGVFVALDSVPAGDDVVIDREIAAISRMTGSGAIVAVSLLPEDALLAERLTDSVCVSPRIFSFRMFSIFGLATLSMMSALPPAAFRLLLVRSYVTMVVYVRIPSYLATRTTVPLSSSSIPRFDPIFLMKNCSFACP